MNYIIAALSLASVGGLAWAALLALRNGSLKKELADADHALNQSEKNVIDLSAELKENVGRHSALIVNLRNDIRELEADLEKSTKPGDRRKRIERLFNKTKT